MANKPVSTLKELSVRGIGRIVVRPGTSDEAVAQHIFEQGQLDLSNKKQFGWVRSSYDRIVSAGFTPLIIDCGSNIGLSSVFFAAQFPKAKIVAIEPAADNVAIARLNTASRPNIETLQAAVHDTKAALKIADPHAEKWAYRVVETDAATDGIEAVTINEIVQRHGSSNLLAVKVDIEGGEHALFRSNLEWLNVTPLLTIELHDWLFPGKSTSETFFKAIEGRRFEITQNGEHLSLFFKK